MITSSTSSRRENGQKQVRQSEMENDDTGGFTHVLNTMGVSSPDPYSWNQVPSNNHENSIHGMKNNVVDITPTKIDITYFLMSTKTQSMLKTLST